MTSYSNAPLTFGALLLLLSRRPGAAPPPSFSLSRLKTDRSVS
jgi:hypothetical protein